MTAHSDIPFELIPAFLTLSEELNISRAARRLNLSQPALTRKLKNLESSLGVQLFLRQSRGLAPTLAGRELKRTLMPAFEKMNAAFAEAKNAQTKLQGQIIFGCFSEIGNHLIVPLLLKFSRQHPDVYFDVRYLSEFEIISGLSDGSIHVGLANKAPNQDGLKSYRIFTEHIQLFTSITNPDVEKNPRPNFVGYRMQDRLLKELLKTIYSSSSTTSERVVFSVNSHAAMISAVQELNLYAALPQHSILESLRNSKIRIASRKKLINDVHLVVPAVDFPERKLIELTKFLRTQLKPIEDSKT